MIVVLFILYLTPYLSPLTSVYAQNPHLLTGQILDASTGEPVPFASCQYKGHNIGMVSDIEGNYSIARITVGSSRSRL